MINIPLILLIAIIGYALAITGLFLCAFAISASDRQKAAAIIHNLKTQVRHFILEADKARSSLKDLEDAYNIHTITSNDRILELQAVAENRQERLIDLLHDYVKVQNEYAWYRVTRGAETPTYLKAPLSSVKSASSAPQSAESAGNKEATDA